MPLTIAELQNRVLDLSISVSQLLREALVLSHKLGRQDFESWITSELKGYKDTEALPDYRMLSGLPVALKLQGYFEPIYVSHLEANIVRKVSTLHFADPIAKIEGYIFADKDEEFIILSYGHENEQLVASWLNVPAKPCLQFDRSQFQSILDHVRDELLDWCLKLAKEAAMSEQSTKELYSILKSEPKRFLAMTNEEAADVMMPVINNLKMDLYPKNVVVSLHSFYSPELQESISKKINQVWNWLLKTEFLEPDFRSGRGPGAALVSDSGKRLNKPGDLLDLLARTGDGSESNESSPRSLQELRDGLTDIQQQLIDAIWECFVDSGATGNPAKWLEQADAYERFDQEPVREAVKSLGDNIVNLFNSQPAVYQLGIVGMMLTTDHKRLEDLLVSFFEFVESHYRAIKLTLNQFKEECAVDDEQIYLLTRVLNIAWHPKNLRLHYAPEDLGGWYVGLVEWVELSRKTDFRKYIQDEIWDRYQRERASAVYALPAEFDSPIPLTPRVGLVLADLKSDAVEESKIMKKKDTPKLFIGSSREGHDIATNIELNLEHDAEVTIWSMGIFGLSQGNLESLVKALPLFDFAILVLTPDDVTISRDQETQSPRDNVLFELGLFMGRLGRERTYIVHDSQKPIKLPSDLAGITPATFKGNRQDGNLRAALSPACTKIREQIRKLGCLR